MKILHACLSNWYVDGFGYQENALIEAHVTAGHDVVVVASTEVIRPSGLIEYLSPGHSLGAEGAPVTRLPYVRWLPNVISRKVRAYRGLRRFLVNEDPDVIFFHGCAGWALLTVKWFVDSNPETIFNIDSHEDHTNSARTWPAKLLHRHFYGPIARRASRSAGPILCVTTSTIDFLEEMYKLQRQGLEFFPIGGHVDPDDEYLLRRGRARLRLGLSEGQRLVLQAGKFTESKRVSNTVAAFRRVSDPTARLVLAGSFPNDMPTQDVERALDEDRRIAYLGWQSPEDLRDLLCAADIYVQPGSQSVTMQQSLCSRCAIIISDMPSHRLYIEDNGWLVSDDASLQDALCMACSPEISVAEMGNRSLNIARNLLDYSVLAKRALKRQR
jgi:1,2-diacylglycerol 3-alpha-glucosyltransferase